MLKDGNATGVLLFEWMHLEDKVGGNQRVSLLQDDLSLASASLL